MPSNPEYSSPEHRTFVPASVDQPLGVNVVEGSITMIGPTGALALKASDAREVAALLWDAADQAELHEYRLSDLDS